MSNSGNQDEPLLFAWKRLSVNRRFLLFVVASLALHALFFWAFAVKYPDSTQKLPTTARLVVLNAGDPATLDVLRQIEDRVAALDESMRSASRMPEGIVKEVRFSPLYAGREPRLKTLPPMDLDAPLPSFFRSGETRRPTFTRTDREPTEAIPPVVESGTQIPVPKISVHGGALSDRDLAKPVDWTNGIEVLASSDGGFASFYLGVNERGRVKFCLFSEGRESEAAGFLDQLVRRLEFDPAPGSGTQWGWVDLRW